MIKMTISILATLGVLWLLILAGFKGLLCLMVGMAIMAYLIMSGNPILRGFMMFMGDNYAAECKEWELDKNPKDK